MPAPVVLQPGETHDNQPVSVQKRRRVIWFLPLVVFLLSPPMSLGSNLGMLSLYAPSFSAQAQVSGGAKWVATAMQQAAAAMHAHAQQQPAVDRGGGGHAPVHTVAYSLTATVTGEPTPTTMLPNTATPSETVPVTATVPLDGSRSPSPPPVVSATMGNIQPTHPLTKTETPSVAMTATARHLVASSTPLPTFAARVPTATPVQLPGVGYTDSDWSKHDVPGTAQPTTTTTRASQPAARRQDPLATLPAGDMRYIPILMYHYIREVDQTVDPMGYRLSVSPTQFAAQLAWLAQEGYVTLRMDEAAACLQGKRGCPPRAIVLTFDDGYMDAYTDALPLLQKHGFVATFYVVAAFIGEHGYMGWDELEQLRDAGMEIGSHTLTHPNLTILSRDQASYEILHSAEIIGGNLQVPMHSFCYPIGKFTPLVKSLVQEAGYTNAVTTMQSGYQGDGYALPRLRISGEMGQLGFESMITSYTPAMPTSQGTPSP